MFLIMASPVFADESPFRDDVVNEQLPPVEVSMTPVQKVSFVQKFKDKFHKTEKVKKQEPEKTIKSVKKEQKKQAKLLKKQKKNYGSR